MERKLHVRSVARILTALAGVALACAAAADLARNAVPEVSPAVAYSLTAAAIFLASTGVLLRVLARDRRPLRNTLEMAATGLVLLAWWLRGDPGVAADPPIIAAAALSAIVLIASALVERPAPTGR